MGHIPQIDYAAAAPESRAAFDEEVRLRGSVTNMKRTLLHSVPAYRAYMEWYSLRDAILPLIGERGVVVFSHAISTQNDCLVCSTYFRRALADLGLSPDGFEPTEEDALLIDFGRAIAAQSNAVPADLWARLKARYGERELVDLVAFAGLMVATNLFNNVLQVDLDDHLHAHRKA